MQRKLDHLARHHPDPHAQVAAGLMRCHTAYCEARARESAQDAPAPAEQVPQTPRKLAAPVLRQPSPLRDAPGDTPDPPGVVRLVP
jgi:hypothetical protein